MNKILTHVAGIMSAYFFIPAAVTGSIGGMLLWGALICFNLHTISKNNQGDINE